MYAYLLRRTFSTILTLWLVSVAIFAMSEVVPSNIAINTLGNTITADQERSFNAQNGLDQPSLTRYIRWMIGSDWQVTERVGKPIVQLYEQSTRRYTWWIVDHDGSLYQTATDDSMLMRKIIRTADGGTRTEPLPLTIWQPNAEGYLTFWGVDQAGHAAMWIHGSVQKTWTITKATWISVPGAPKLYIPLQKGLIRGDPGVSFLTRRPVGETLWPRLKNTLLLASIAFGFIMPLALALGLWAGANEGRFIDRLLSITSLIATATPEFATGVFLVIIFSFWLKLFPGAVVVTSDAGILDNPKMLVLPVLSLTLAELGYVLRITRASMVEIMRANYIRTAVLKGLPRFRIIFRHAMRNALMAPITVIMLHVNWLVGGLVIVESVFGYPGLGRYALEAALFRDVFAVEATAMVLVLIAVLSQMGADIAYMFLNPRIRFP